MCSSDLQVHPFLIGQSYFASAWYSQIELTFPNLHILFALPAGAEWESAFLTQPPCAQVKIEVAGDALGLKYETKITSADCITLGQVVNTLKNAITLDVSESDYGRAAARSVRVTGFIRGWVWSDADIVKRTELFEASLKQPASTCSNRQTSRKSSLARIDGRKKGKHADRVASAMNRIITRLSSDGSAIGRITRRSSLTMRPRLHDGFAKCIEA